MGLKHLREPSIQKFTSKKTFKISIIYLIAIGSVIFAGLFGLFVSSVSIPIQTIVSIITHKMFNIASLSDFTLTEQLIIWEIRLPRVIIGLLVGASLSLAGATLQGLLRNPLAEPYTIGISAGSSLGAVIVIYFKLSLFGLGIMTTLPFVSIIGALVALISVLLITRLSYTRLANETIILAGIILSSFINAIITLLISLSSKEEMSMILYWMMGNLGMKTWVHVWLMLPFFVVGSLILLLKTKELNALSLGENAASHIGVNVKKEKILLLLAATLLTGSAVSISGAIGFVGLVIPHLVRIVIGANHKNLLPLSMLIGGAFLAFADSIARTVIEPRELPIGVITALIGAPVFSWLLVRHRTGKRGLK
ncbi:MAG: hypothetical protein RLZZ267_1381 [Bacillota bacterium]